MNIVEKIKKYLSNSLKLALETQLEINTLPALIINTKEQYSHYDKTKIVYEINIFAKDQNSLKEYYKILAQISKYTQEFTIADNIIYSAVGQIKEYKETFDTKSKTWHMLILMEMTMDIKRGIDVVDTDILTAA